jgi:winged helix DNA-binding protein
MSGRGYGDPEHMAETGDLAGQAITRVRASRSSHGRFWPYLEPPVRSQRLGSIRAGARLLGYHDRGRIIDDVHRGLSVAGARVVLVDGRVVATWNVEAGTVIVTPLRRFSRADHTTVAEQGRELAAFLSDNESHRVRVAASPR